MIFNEREVTRNEKGKPREKREEWFQLIWGHFSGIFKMFLFNFQVVIFVDFETFLTWPVLLFFFIFYFSWSTWEFFFKTGNFTLIKWLQCYVIYCTFLGFYLTTFRAVSCAAAATLTLLRLRSFRSAPASAACPLLLPLLFPFQLQPHSPCFCHCPALCPFDMPAHSFVGGKLVSLMVLNVAAVWREAIRGKWGKGESALGWIVVAGRSGSSLCPVFTLEPCQLPWRAS